MVVTAVLGLLWGPAPALAAGRCGERPWCDRSLSPDTRAERLLSRLTLREKLELMGGDDPLGFLAVGRSSGTVNGIRRLGVPPLYVNDGPAGVREGYPPEQAPATALPAPIALAASFDPRLAGRYGAMIAREAKRRGHDLMLGPMVNIVRVPEHGRAFEGYGEDPHLSGRMGVGWIRGLQREGVIANVKHYAANNQETDRFTVNAVIDERALREIYLPHFEAAVRHGRVGTVMSAYNKVGGDFMGANRRLLRGVLMRSFGFDGFVLSDWFAGGDTVGSAKAGQSVAMPSPLYYEPGKLASALVSGRLGVRTIDGLVRRYLRVMFRFGVFDRAAFPRKAAIPVRRHGRFARAVARRGIVLLRNRRGLLPLDSRRVDSLAVIGQAAAEYQAGGGSSHVDPFYEVTALEGIRRRAGRRIGVRFDDGSDPRRAAELARTSDAAIVSATVGSTEFSDRRCLALDCPPAPSRQDDLIRAVAAANRRTVVLLQDPGPVLMPWARRVAAIVEAWYPGEEGGNAIAAVLFGDVNPSAKLPVSYPRRQQDPPAREPPEFPGVGGNVFYTEGVLVGYRHYDERRIRPLFPFGHGLSYTSFDYGPLSIRRLPRQRWRVSVSVSNTGRRAGTEVAQLYLGLPDPRRGVVQPPKALKGFARVALPPRRSRRVSFVLGRRAFSWWDARADRWRVARGCYRVLVGSSSRDVRRRGVISRGGARCRRR